MPLFSCAGTRPSNLEVKDARLAPCPSSPNCVSSDDADAAHFISSLQLALPAGANLIAVRSAARLGYSDLGVNRKRVENLQSLLRRQGVAR